MKDKGNILTASWSTSGNWTEQGNMNANSTANNESYATRGIVFEDCGRDELTEHGEYVYVNGV